MRVSQLIESLQTYNQELEVTIAHKVGSQEPIVLSEICQVSNSKFMKDGVSKFYIVIVDESTRVLPQPEPQSKDETPAQV